jgi:nitrilase
MIDHEYYGGYNDLMSHPDKLTHHFYHKPDHFPQGFIMASRKIRVGVAQFHTRSTSAETLNLLESLARTAANSQVGLLLFPEAFLGGYPRSCSFGMSIGHRDEGGRDQYLKYFNDAIDLGDTPQGAHQDWADRKLAIPVGRKFRGDGTREELERIAKETGVFLAVGLIEKAGSSLYCGMVFVCPRNGMLGSKRRKVMPTGSERLIWAQGSTDTLKVTTVTIQGVEVTIGGAICWENYMPLLRYSLYSQGVNIWLAPTADGRETWLPLLRTIAFEGRAFVLSCNQTLQQKDLPSWITQNAPDRQPKSIPRSFRRTSIIQKIDEGNEICLPKRENDKSSRRSSDLNKPPIFSRGRRKSSIIQAENGIEFCLPCVEEPSIGVVDTNVQNEWSIEDSNGHTLGKVPSSALEIEEDGNETTGIPEEYVSRGGSCLISPYGEVLKGPSWETEEILYTEVDIDDCIKGKLDFDVSGHYSRSDAFKLIVEGLEISPPK